MSLYESTVEAKESYGKEWLRHHSRFLGGSTYSGRKEAEPGGCGYANGPDACDGGMGTTAMRDQRLEIKDH